MARRCPATSWGGWRNPAASANRDQATNDNKSYGSCERRIFAQSPQQWTEVEKEYASC